MKFGKNSPLLFLCCILLIILGVNLLRPNLLEGNGDVSRASILDAEKIQALEDRIQANTDAGGAMRRSTQNNRKRFLNHTHGGKVEPPPDVRYDKFVSRQQRRDPSGALVRPPPSDEAGPAAFYGGKGVRLSPANSF